MVLRALSKLLFVVAILSFFILAVPFLVIEALGTGFTAAKQDTLLVTSFKKTNWESFGVVGEPEIELEIKTPNGYVQKAFLLDSGAIISSLPREFADILGANLAFLPRIAFRGFGNKTSFAYQSQMTIKLIDRLEVIDVVFTEASATKPLLGRKGFFDKFTVILDSRNDRIEIRG